MCRHGLYYQQRIVPCECGSHEPYWHGDEHGLRIYCCDECWKKKGASDPLLAGQAEGSDE